MSGYKGHGMWMERRRSHREVRGDEQGIAMLTVVMVLLIMTVLGVAAMTVTGMENNMAGLQRTMEASAQAAESCLGTGANVITQSLLPESGGAITAALQDSAGGPVPAGNAAILADELIGKPENSPDIVETAPNLRMSVGPYTVVGDIDRLYLKLKAGSGQQQNAAYDGIGVGAGSGGSEVYYRVTCIATNAASGAESRVAAIYVCSFTGDGCQRQL